MFRDLVDEMNNSGSEYSSEPPEPDLFLDVPFVPSDDEIVAAMLKLAAAGPEDVLYDLGSGDGRILVEAAKERDTRGVGIDIDPLRVAEAMEYAGFAGVEHLVDFIEGDIFEEDFSKATIVTLYLLDTINVQLRPRLLGELRPGARIISHAFDMGDWKPDDRVELSGIRIYKWIVPAQVAGVWEWETEDGRRYRVDLEQEYQEVSGKAWLDDNEVSLNSADLRGSRLNLELQKGEDGPVERVRMTFAKDDRGQRQPPRVRQLPAA